MNKDSLRRETRTLEKPLWIGAHFGFVAIDAPKVTDKDRAAVRDCSEDDSLEANSASLFDASEKAAFLRLYNERNFAALPHPLAVAFKKHSQKKTAEYSFELAGFQGGCAEALLIRTALSALSESGYGSLVIDLNSIGDKDSIAAYDRELGNYAKRIASELDGDLRKRIKKNVYELLKVVSEGEGLPEAIRDKMPTSISTLSPQSRAHFKEVLEHIEALGAEFRLIPSLVGNRAFCSETLFAVRDSETGATLALGYRYSRLSKKLGWKKELPLAGMTLFLPEKALDKQKLYKEAPKPKFYLVQLGKDARMKTVPLIETLRQQRIAVYHALGRDKITAQLEGAERSRVPYLLIVGQKEALEDSVTIRNVSTRAQDTIYMRDLPQYLKNLPF